MISRFIGLLAVWVLLILASVASAPFLFADPDRCPELVTDYSLRCSEGVTDCSSFCFYGVCRDCKNASHGDHCALCTGSHQYEVSPCIEWDWYLYDPQHGRVVRHDVYESPNVWASLEFGMVPPDYEFPVNPCVTEMGVDYIPPGGVVPAPPAPLAPREAGVPFPDGRVHLTSGTQDHPEDVTISDLTHLPSTPGEPGAPALSEVVRLNDLEVELVITGGPPVLFHEYRYWSYSGGREGNEGSWGGVGGGVEKSPSVFRVPFEKMDPDHSSFGIRDVRGIISFQVRGIDLYGVPTGISNIIHEMIGMEGFRVIEPVRTTLQFQPELPPPPTLTPLPPWESPSLDPPSVIASVVQLPSPPAEPGTVEVTMASVYPGRVQYRWWPHSGHDSTNYKGDLDWPVPPPGEWRVPTFGDWVTAPILPGENFFEVEGLLPDTPMFSIMTEPYTYTRNGRTWELGGEDPYEIANPAVFNFQARVLGSSVVSDDPSEIEVALVWPGEYKAWNAGYAGSRPTPVPIETPTPTPTPAPESALHPDCGLAVTNPDEILLSYDCANMLAFKAMLEGGSGSLNWSRTRPIRSWNGVFVPSRLGSVEDPRVTRILLSNAGLRGQVPAMLSLLTFLKHIDLSGNDLTGGVPSDLVDINLLETLDVSHNNLSGPFPDLSGMDTLLELQLNGNRFVGPVLGRLHGLDLLRELDISNNSIGGRVVNYLYHSPRLQILRISGNLMTGCYPGLLDLVLVNDVDNLGLEACDPNSGADNRE